MSEIIDQTPGDPKPSAAPRAVALAFALGLARYFAAWAVAVVVAAVSLFAIGAVLDAFNAAIAGDDFRGLQSFENDLKWLIVAAAFIALMTAPVWPVLVFLSRLTRVRRGVSDAVLGALMGAADSIVFGGLSVKPGIVAVFFVAGGLAGFFFWLVAGRPRPPYRHLWLPG